MSFFGNKNVAPLSNIVSSRLVVLSSLICLIAPATRSVAQEVKLGDCYARWTDSVLIVGNSHIERRWAIDGESLRPTSFYDRDAKGEWLSTAANPPKAPFAPGRLTVAAHGGSFGPVEAPSLEVDVSGSKTSDIRYRMQIFAEARGVEIDQQPVVAASAFAPAKTSASGGASITESETSGGQHKAIAIPDELALVPQHLRLTQVAFADATDNHNQLVMTREWMFMNNEEDIPLRGNLFYVEDVVTGAGLIFLMQAPPPSARANPVDADLRVMAPTRTFRFLSPDYPEIVLAFSGGRTGRIQTLQTYQRQLRQYVPARDGLFLSNTWGDRNRDTRINADFISKEIAAGAKIGVDVVQIDDGWQSGHSMNSARGPGTANGFWSAEKPFWSVDQQRFPAGLGPLVAQCSASGMKMGLWYAPDSSAEFANWQKDANQILDIYRKQGISYFKFDSIHMSSRKAEDNLHRMFDSILKESKGAIVIDLDVTGGGKRPGFFGSMNSGPIFVENRYSDYHRYWPHLTLRNFWELSEFVDPLRLRMELLNNTRSVQRYPDDPLAPAKYSADALFATVMFSNPLGWFETSSLPPQFDSAITPLVTTWKQHREEVYSGTIIPIGSAPDGVSWTGFVSTAKDRSSGTMLIFRELNDKPDWSTPILLPPGKLKVSMLAGKGTARVEGDQLVVHIPNTLQYVWVKLDAASQ